MYYFVNNIIHCLTSVNIFVILKENIYKNPYIEYMKDYENDECRHKNDP